MANRIILSVVLGLAFSLYWPLRGQSLEVIDASTPPYTPENLITNVFLGKGVEVISVTYEGVPTAVGYFKNGMNSIGLDRGLVMTTGLAAGSCANPGGTFGANCLGGDFANNNNGIDKYPDPDLDLLIDDDINDVSIYTIKFRPFGDTLLFRYVFASEEYPEFSCSSFNDVFGFFISGPGINGPFSNNAENIALIPGTNEYVSINNLHPQNGAGCPPKNVQYYNSNLNSNNQPVYDGFTDVFTAMALVIPCEEYTIRLVVADVQDNIFDTGVFLEAKSFGSPSLKVEANTVSYDGVIAEGCTQGAFNVHFPTPVDEDTPLQYSIIGTAQNGVDYVAIPDNLFIPAGDTGIIIEVIALEDGIDEPIETVGLDIQRDLCNRDTFWLYIKDNELIPPQLPADTIICPGQPGSLDGTLPLPTPPPPTFTNDQPMPYVANQPLYSPIEVLGVQPVTLQPGVIRSVCVNIETKWADDIDLYLISPSGRFIELSTDNGKNCDNYDQVCFSPTATTPISDFFNVPPCPAGSPAPFNNGTWAPEGVWSVLWDGDYPTNGTWQLLLIDDQPGFDGTLLSWTITFEPTYQIHYRWDPTEGLSCADCPDPIATPDTTTTYVLTASDSYGCAVYDSITIVTLDNPPTPIVQCDNSDEHSITFTWDDVPTNQGFLVSVDGGPWMPPNNGNLSHRLDGLPFLDTVTIQVVALNQCNSDTASLTCWTPPCTQPSITLVGLTDATCPGAADGTATFQASGGAGGYTWQLGNTTNTTGFFDQLPAGQYTVTVTDSDNCPQTLGFSIGEPPALSTVASVVQHITCFGAADGAASVVASGGTEPYTFLWDNGSTDAMATDLGPGLHSVLITDANGCTAMDEVDITEPTELTAFTLTDSVDCHGASSGEAFVQIEGGVPDYEVQWDAAAGNATTPLVTGLPAGTYQVIVTDQNGCTTTATATVFEPPMLTADAAGTDAACHGSSDASVWVEAAGGTPGYTYLWSSGQNTASVTGLPAGNYEVTVTDAKGCTATAVASPTEPAELMLTLEWSDVSCAGGNDGQITPHVQGGTPPYAFFWGGMPADSVFQDLTAGTYCLEVRDANGCTISDCQDIAEPAALKLSATNQQAGCPGQNQGRISLDISGGVTPYVVQWDHGAFGAQLMNLPPGTYHAIVTDANGCSIEYQTTLSNSTPIELTFANTPTSCFGTADGRSVVTVNGGTPPYNYFWSNGEAGNPAVQLPGGTVYVTVVDSEGCERVDSTFIAQPASLEVQVNVEPISCFGKKDGKISVEAKGGSPPYTYSIDGVSFVGNPVFLLLGPDTYYVHVIDSRNCTWTSEPIVLVEPPLLRLDLGPDTVIDYGETIELVPTILGVAPNEWDLLQYHWHSNNPQIPPLDSLAPTGTFTIYTPTTVKLTVTNAQGCTASDLINLFVRKFRNILVPTGFTPGTDGRNDLLLVHGNSRLVEKINFFRVYDRWGEVLFEARDFQINDTQIGWDGTFRGQPMPAGVYAWYVEVSFIDGSTERYSGHTTLIR